MIIHHAATGRDTPRTVLERAGNDWRTCATDLIQWLVKNDRCFSSGEIALYLRTHRPEVVFSVLTLGDQLRNWYYGKELPPYDAGYPTMVSREFLDAEGKPRKVFVFAPSESAGRAHDFQVKVPLPAEVRERAPKVKPEPVEEFVATIRSNRRCVVPRGAVERHIHLHGTPFQVEEDPIFLTYLADGDVWLSLDSSPGAVPVFLWSGGGRVQFPAPKGHPGYEPDTVVALDVSSKGIRVTFNGRQP
jgi:hypothetical protein